MTQLQRDAWAREVRAWMERQIERREGRTVHWALRILEAERTCTREEMLQARRQVDICQQNYRRVPREQKKLWAERLREARRYLRDMHTFDVVARPLHDDRMMIVCQFDNDLAKQLADIEKDSVIYVAGVVQDMRLPEVTDGVFSVFQWHTAQPFDAAIRLVRCETGEKVKAYVERQREHEKKAAKSAEKPRPEPAAPKPPPVYNAAEQAAKKLSMAKLYQANKMHDKARELLQAVIAEYPETDAAEEAKDILGTMSAAE